jgi:hypothetical protein
MSSPEQIREAPTDGRSIGELIGEISDDLSRLFRQEVDLAKAELRTEAGKAGQAAGMLGAAGVAGFLTAVFVSMALMFALAEVMPIGWAAVIVGVVWGVLGAVLYASGRAKLRTVSPVPRLTVETLKEDAQWLRHPTG